MTKTKDKPDHPVVKVKDVSARDLRFILEGFAKLVVKAQFAMNGGAAIAMLTFIGTGAANAYRSSAVYALGFFSTGVFLAAMVSALSMFAAKQFYEAKQHEADSAYSQKEHNGGKRIYYISCACVVASALVFAVGVFILCCSILTAAAVAAGPS